MTIPVDFIKFAIKSILFFSFIYIIGIYSPIIAAAVFILFVISKLEDHESYSD